jgi:hypothetical protein
VHRGACTRERGPHPDSTKLQLNINLLLPASGFRQQKKGVFMKSWRPINLQEYKIQASILLKSLRAGDIERSQAAAVRFQRLPEFKSFSADEIHSRRAGIKLKHALNLIAVENNRASWPDLKRIVSKREAIQSNRAYTNLYPAHCEGFYNEWYANHDDAHKHLLATGGYLLPYKNHFFICRNDYITALGLDPDDPDWKLIGWDWAKPSDLQAWQRLNSKLKKLSKADR